MDAIKNARNTFITHGILWSVLQAPSIFVILSGCDALIKDIMGYDFIDGGTLLAVLSIVFGLFCSTLLYKFGESLFCHLLPMVFIVRDVIPIYKLSTTLFTVFNVLRVSRRVHWGVVAKSILDFYDKHINKKELCNKLNMNLIPFMREARIRRHSLGVKALIFNTFYHVIGLCDYKDNDSVMNSVCDITATSVSYGVDTLSAEAGAFKNSIIYDIYITAVIIPFTIFSIMQRMQPFSILVCAISISILLTVALTQRTFLASLILCCNILENGRGEVGKKVVEEFKCEGSNVTSRV